ncbi:MAG: hypothetical protein ACI89X_003564 [Planctomycetota bacterium]|jgi:hypothetical protein
MRIVIHTLLIIALTVWGLCGIIAWVVRDGLGPDTVESHGREALARFFWTFYWGPVAIVLVAAAVLWARHARRLLMPASANRGRPN